MKIGQIIREIRKERKSTLEELAFRLGTDAANLSRIERGKQNATPEILERVSTTFDLPISSLYLMAEQNIEPYLTSQNSGEFKNASERLDKFVAKFMMLDKNNQSLVLEFMSTMIKSQENKK